MWVEIRASSHETGGEEPTDVQALREGGKTMANFGTRREGSAVFMCWESGEGLCRPTLPDRGDAKPGAVDTSTQITM